jgi:hypothetical protein
VFAAADDGEPELCIIGKGSVEVSDGDDDVIERKRHVSPGFL